jgi:hypothetical protein
MIFGTDIWSSPPADRATRPRQTPHTMNFSLARGGQKQSLPFPPGTKLCTAMMRVRSYHYGGATSPLCLETEPLAFGEREGGKSLSQNALPLWTLVAASSSAAARSTHLYVCTCVRCGNAGVIFCSGFFFFPRTDLSAELEKPSAHRSIHPRPAVVDHRGPHCSSGVYLHMQPETAPCNGRRAVKS